MAEFNSLLWLIFDYIYTLYNIQRYTHIYTYVCVYICIYVHTHIDMGFPGDSPVKNPTTVQETQ